MLNKNKYDFPKEILDALENLDNIPTTEQDAVPGIPGKLFIIAPEQKEELFNIVRRLDSISEKEYLEMDDEEKWYYSTILNNAEIVLKNSISRPGHIREEER
ncbi:MAG: hypothetical protein ACC608_03190 [Anaerofustis sp.]